MVYAVIMDGTETGTSIPDPMEDTLLNFSNVAEVYKDVQNVVMSTPAPPEDVVAYIWNIHPAVQDAVMVQTLRCMAAPAPDLIIKLDIGGVLRVFPFTDGEEDERYRVELRGSHVVLYWDEPHAQLYARGLCDNISTERAVLVNPEHVVRYRVGRYTMVQTVGTRLYLLLHRHINEGGTLPESLVDHVGYFLLDVDGSGNHSSSHCNENGGENDSGK